MWLSHGWNDYELLDCGSSERLERWGDRYLVRPDPQAIWPRGGSHPKWNSPDGRYERSKSGGGMWHKYSLPPSWEITYGPLTFGIKPMNFKHTGVFPEQAANWDFIMRAISSAGREISVLNLFAYTGGATIAAASAGASVCHVDAAKGMVAWGKENAVLSGLSERPIRWIVDDCTKFVEREIRRGRRYDVVIMDPPSYGRGPSGEVWRLEEGLFDLVSLAAGVLSENPLFFLVNSYTTGLSASVLGYILNTILSPRFRGQVRCDELGLPVTASGLALPCGSAGRWMSDGCFASIQQ
ncbi:class I SAM-dependent methyltransferase [Oscillospiraceae bacterium OttesenSCG-928-G22]|nr:class I SAM-dependent methyltransferase [Oscillospiraceae bacterium OttesenSCG-928-G22]